MTRAARAGEAGPLSALALRSKAHWGYDEAFLEACREELAVAEADIAAGLVAVAEDAGAVLGFATVRLEAPAELEALFVDPAVMGKGAGRALVAWARETARAAGVASLLVESDPNAEPFYLRHGAVRIGERTSPSTGRALPLLRLAT